MATDDKNGSVKLNLPKAFDGNRDKFRKFLQTAKIYLGINKKVYDDDLKKIGFILFFMTEDGKLVIIYMDDILIFAETKEELERITKMVLAKLREHDLFLKAKKCEFSKQKIKYLGMVIKEGQISMDPIKLAGI